MPKIEKAIKVALFSFLRLFVHVQKVGTIPRHSVHRILIVRQHNQLGDMLCAVPLFRALRATFPDAYIALLARPLNSEVLRNAQYLNEIIVYDKKQFIHAPFEVWRFARSLKKKKFDVVLVPSTVSMSVSSDIIAFLSGTRRRIGPASLAGKKNLTGYLYNTQVPLDWSKDPTVHQTQRNMDIASILVLHKPSLELEIGLTQQEISDGKEFLTVHCGERELVVGFHPGAAKPENKWDAVRFAEIANRCAEIYGAFIVISEGPDDAEPVREMIMHMPNEHVKIGTPVRFAASVIHHCDIFLSNDTGMMHVAAGTGTPTLSLFGPTDPLQWAPLGKQHRFILGKGNSLDGLTVDKVWTVLVEMLTHIVRTKEPEKFLPST